MYVNVHSGHTVYNRVYTGHGYGYGSFVYMTKTHFLHPDAVKNAKLSRETRRNLMGIHSSSRRRRHTGNMEGSAEGDGGERSGDRRGQDGSGNRDLAAILSYLIERYDPGLVTAKKLSLCLIYIEVVKRG